MNIPEMGIEYPGRNREKGKNPITILDNWIIRDVMTIQKIKECILSLTSEYPIQKVILFGSRAAGTNREDSDVDLIVEFSRPITLLTLSGLKLRLEEMLGLEVDLVHGPIRKTDMIEVEKEVVLYAA